MQNRTSTTEEKNLSNVIKIDQAQVQAHLGEMVRSTVEETLNAMLDAEADHLCNAQRYEHTEARTDQRAGHYKQTTHVHPHERRVTSSPSRKTVFEGAFGLAILESIRWVAVWAIASKGCR